MKFATAVILAASMAGSAFAQSTITINTPSNAVVCQPLLLSWSGGSPPYFLSILPGNQPSAAALETFPQTSSTSLTWNVDIAQGTSVGLTLRDSKGLVAQSAPFTINPGSDTSCIGKGQSSASGSATGTGTATGSTGASTGASSAAGPATSATTPAAGGNTPAASTRPTAAASGTSGSSSSSSSPKPSNGATANAVSLGAVGAAVLALLA